MSTQPHKELRIKRGSHILEYIRAFSATEKAIFGVCVVIALYTSLMLLSSVNTYFMTDIPAHGGELREGMIGLPRTINPIFALSGTDRDISTRVYSGLMKYQGDTLVGDIAKSYNVSSDGLTYSFVLRTDVQFQDGTRLTADDVAFTIQKIQDAALKSPHRSDWLNVGVKVTSPSEIQFILKQPYSPFLANTTIGIIPKHIWGGVSDDQFIFSQYNIEPVGSGPYKVTGIVRDAGGIPTTYTLSTWNGYYGTIPYIQTITLVFIADETNAMSAIDAGTIDSLASVSPLEAKRLAGEKAGSYSVLSSPLPRVFGVFFNQNQNIVLADKNVRQALDMSVDRTGIVQKILGGYGEPIQGPLPHGMGTTVDTNDLPDIAGAQALLEKNGWKKNADGIYAKISKDKKTSQLLSFDIDTADTPDLKQTAELVKNSWTALGAQVDIKIFESSDLYQNIIRPRKYDALLFGELIGKDRDLYAFWHSSQRNAPGLNVSMYTNTKADKLLDDIRTTSDESVQTQKYTQFEKIIHDDIPAVFLYTPDFIYVVPKSIHNIFINNISTPADRWNSMQSWYLETEAVWNIFANK